MKLWAKIFIGLLTGALSGLFLGQHALYLKPIGTIFLNLINMVIVPLIFSSMTVGITHIQDPKKLKRIGGKALGLYFIATFIAICIAFLFAHVFHVGEGLSFHAEGLKEPTSPSLVNVLVSIVPTNPIAAFANANILQIIVFSFFLGIAINCTGEKGKPLLSALESLSEVMYRLTGIIMEFSPIGVFAIMAWVTGTFGLQLLVPLFKFLAVYYLACFFHVGVVYFNLLKWMGKVKIGPFFKGIKDALMVAFSTGSSVAALPVALHCVQKNLGVSKSIADFILPLGLSVNMNGTAIFQAMSAVFVATTFGISLDFYSYTTLFMITMLSAIGTAGVPGSGFIMLSAVLSSVGLPLEGLAIIAGIDKLREMVTTTVNILGDAVVTVCIAKQEGAIDEQLYYQDELVLYKPSDI